MYDYHVHSENSHDAQDLVLDICNAAINQKSKGIAFTEHIDKKTNYEFNYVKYSEDIKRAKNIFGEKLKIIKGVEIGITLKNLNQVKKIISNKFDFIILSTHYVGNNHIASKEFLCNYTETEVMEKYFQNLYNIVSIFKNYHVLGHLDIIRRYDGFKTLEIKEKRILDLIDEILLTIINDNRGIEVNTSLSFGSTDLKLMPNINVIKRYKKLGGNIITVGSDAHFLKDVCYGVSETYKLLKDIGYKYISVIDNNSFKFEKI